MPHQPRFKNPLATQKSIATGEGRYGSGDTTNVLGASKSAPSKIASSLSRLFGAVALVTATVGFSACDGSVPQTDQSELVIPDVEVARSASARSLPLSNGGEADGEEEEYSECSEFITVEESYDEQTGDFRYEYVCADDGGDIERTITEGNDDGAGNGYYTSKYIMRDGSEEVWTVEYRLLEDGATQETIGTNNFGESYVVLRTYQADGSALAEEVYTYNEATYTLSGVYDAEGRFSGDYIVDLNSTPDINPDYTMIHIENPDGSMSQSYDGVDEYGNIGHYDYSVSATGEVEYSFTNDSPATVVTPDVEGDYSYAADGSGEGGYLQRYDDGSLMTVEDIINADGSVIESWVFDDAATPQDVDQEGIMTYNLDGSGSGTVTTFVENGDSQTCDITIDVDGTTTTVCN